MGVIVDAEIGLHTEGACLISIDTTSHESSESSHRDPTTKIEVEGRRIDRSGQW
jgi:hypothetical protein